MCKKRIRHKKGAGNLNESCFTNPYYSFVKAQYTHTTYHLEKAAEAQSL